MRTSLTAVLGSLLLAACGSDDHPASAVVAYPDYAGQRSAIVVSDGEPASTEAADQRAGSASCTPRTCAAEGFTCGKLEDGCGGTEECGTCPSGLACSNDAGGICGKPSEMCKPADLRLLGSCAVRTNAPPFESGAHCLDYYDARTTATTKELQLSCLCAQGVWSADKCAARVASRECKVESTTACGRSVWCYPN
jgi:hypothetical protein